MKIAQTEENEKVQVKYLPVGIVAKTKTGYIILKTWGNGCVVLKNPDGEDAFVIGCWDSYKDSYCEVLGTIEEIKVKK